MLKINDATYRVLGKHAVKIEGATLHDLSVSSKQRGFSEIK